MADTAQQTLKGVIEALRADKAVCELVDGRAYSDVPDGEKFPYILVEIQSRPFMADDFSGQLHTVRLHCYSDAPSKKEALLIRAAAHALLDRGEGRLAIVGLVKSEQAGVWDCIREDNGKVWDGIGEFELTVM